MSRRRDIENRQRYLVLSPVKPLLLRVLLLCLLSSFVWAEAVNFENQKITIALTQEPPNLSSLMTTDLLSAFILNHVNEGLLRYDRRGRLVAGVAESWQLTSNRIIFELRSNAKWSDGSPVTAHDFVFAWRKINDPALAAPFAAIMHPLKNAEKIQNGELPVDALGVRAIDKLRLEVTLERPCGYCLSLMTHSTFFPVKEQFYVAQGDKYAAEANHLLANGPFVLTDWIHGASLVMKKNAGYWNADAIHLNEINAAYITEDNRTRLNLFRDGSIALARLGAETVRDASSQGLRLRTFATGGIAYLWFNHDERLMTSELKLRRAIQLVFDTNLFVNKVIAIPGYKPVHSFFPSWLNGVEGKFASEYPAAIVQPDLTKAVRLIEELKADRGVDTLPEMTLLTVTSPTGAKIAEYFQGLLKQKLQLDIKVDQQTFKQYLVKIKQGKFDLALSSWYPDFDDIVTYADLITSWNANNRGNYVNEDYDKWFRVLQGSVDTRERMEAAAKLQQIIIDDLPILPTAETGSAYLQHDKLKGVIRRVVGPDPDFTFARVIR